MPSLIVFDDEHKACIRVADRDGQKFDALREKANKEVDRLVLNGDINHDEERDLKSDIAKSQQLFDSREQFNQHKERAGKRERPFELNDLMAEA